MKPRSYSDKPTAGLQLELTTCNSPKFGDMAVNRTICVAGTKLICYSPQENYVYLI